MFRLSFCLCHFWNGYGPGLGGTITGFQRFGKMRAPLRRNVGAQNRAIFARFANTIPIVKIFPLHNERLFTLGTNQSDYDRCRASVGIFLPILYAYRLVLTLTRACLSTAMPKNGCPYCECLSTYWANLINSCRRNLGSGLQG